MDISDFEKIKSRFMEADTDSKIEMYISTEGLNQSQYKELLKHFPLEELGKLERALS